MYPRRRKRTTWMSILLPAAIEIPRVRNGLALVLAAAALAPVTVQAQEDNTGNSLPTLSIASVTVGEDAGSVSVTVTLSASSADAVTVAYSGIDGTATEADGDYSLTDGTLTISAGATTGSVPVTIRDDYLDENNETFKIQLSSPTNAEFAGDNSTIESIVTITDDDTRGVSVWPTSLEIDESRDGYYSVWLISEPTATVTVTPSAHGDSDVTVSGALTFTTENWDTAQEVTVSTAVDTDDDDDTATIRHAVSGGDYASVAASNVSVEVEDFIATSTAVVLFVNPSLVSEGDEAKTVKVTGRLNSLPRDSDTTVSVSVGASGDTAIEGTDYSTVDDLTLTIDEGEVAASVTFTLTPVENDVDAAVKRLSVSGSTQGLTVTGTTVSISDNDTRGLAFYRDRLPVDEGESRVYLIGMLSEPTADVTVTPSIKDADDHVAVSLSGAVTFTADNWNQAKRVTVSAPDDPDAVSGRVWISHSVSGGDYALVKAGDMKVDVTDDDTRGVTFSETYQEVNEGVNGTYTVVLDAQPIVDVVTVTPSIKSSYGTPATVSGALTFTADNWDEAQTVTVTLGQDVDGEDGLVVIEHDVRGGAYALLGVDHVKVKVVDDETESTELILTVDPGSITEGAGETTVTLTIALDAAPFSKTQPISLRVSWPSSQFTVHTNPAPRGVAYLDAGESSITLTYSVTPIDDEYFDPPVRVGISASMLLDESPFYVYHSLRGAKALFLHDNDPPPGVTISNTSVTVDEGDSATYTVVLESKPRTEVTVRPWLTSAYTDVTISSKLTFTGENWDEPQTITVTAAHDDDAADDTVFIRHGVEGGAYRYVYPDGVTVTVDDDETPGITLSTTALVIDEGGRGTYRVGLLAQPTEGVTVTLSVEGDADVTVSAQSTVHGPGVGFSSSLWYTKTVSVSAAHDTDALDDTAVIRHTVIAGGEYASVTVGSTELTATSADADPATWSVNVPANASYITGTSVDVAVNASKTGYTSRTVTRSLAVDLTAPTPARRR